MLRTNHRPHHHPAVWPARARHAGHRLARHEDRHVRAPYAAAGIPWRLAAALDAGDEPARWLDLEVARRRATQAVPRLEHNAALFRQPITTLDAHLALGLRVEALAELFGGFEPREDDDPAILEGADLRFGPPIATTEPA